jgi:hypothetical protein
VVDEREAAAGLEFVEELGTSPRQPVPVRRYRFASQETALDTGERVRAVRAEDPGARRTASR